MAAGETWTLPDDGSDVEVGRLEVEAGGADDAEVDFDINNPPVSHDELPAPPLAACHW